MINNCKLILDAIIQFKKDTFDDGGGGGDGDGDGDGDGLSILITFAKSASFFLSKLALRIKFSQ